MTTLSYADIVRKPIKETSVPSLEHNLLPSLEYKLLPSKVNFTNWENSELREVCSKGLCDKLTKYQYELDEATIISMLLFMKSKQDEISEWKREKQNSNLSTIIQLNERLNNIERCMIYLKNKIPNIKS